MRSPPDSRAVTRSSSFLVNQAPLKRLEKNRSGASKPVSASRATTASSDRGGSAPCSILSIFARTSSGLAPFIRHRTTAAPRPRAVAVPSCSCDSFQRARPARRLQPFGQFSHKVTLRGLTAIRPVGKFRSRSNCVYETGYRRQRKRILLSTTLLDRIVHNAHRITLEGESMRKRKTPTLLTSAEITKSITIDSNQAGGTRSSPLSATCRKRCPDSSKSAATQRDRQQSADFAYERLIGTPAELSQSPGKFQLPLAQNRGAPHNGLDHNPFWRKFSVAGQT